jgi:hypothetical protein
MASEMGYVAGAAGIILIAILGFAIWIIIKDELKK